MNQISHFAFVELDQWKKWKNIAIAYAMEALLASLILENFQGLGFGYRIMWMEIMFIGSICLVYKRMHSYYKNS